MRPAGRGLPLRHDHGGHQVRGSAQRARHIHPLDAEPGRHRIAPASFYETDPDGNRQRAHYDGLPVDFIAEAISTLGAQVADGFETYHVLNPYHDDIGLDEYATG